jgi:transposase
VRHRAEFYYRQFDTLRLLRHEVRRELLTEGRKHGATKLLCEIPSIGPIRAALLVAIVQTPHRFRTKRKLRTYSGLGIETHSSAEHRYVDGELQRSKKATSIRGLNRNHNHDLKYDQVPGGKLFCGRDARSCQGHPDAAVKGTCMDVR